VLSLAATSPANNTVDAAWTAPGDDGPCGQAGSYQLAWSTDPITPANFDAANQVALGAPLAAGSAEVTSFSAPQNFLHVGLRARDEAGNPGWLAVTTVAVLPEPGAAASLAAGAALIAWIARRRVR
jgi:hypothetical protein